MRKWFFCHWNVKVKEFKKPWFMDVPKLEILYGMGGPKTISRQWRNLLHQDKTKYHVSWFISFLPCSRLRLILV